MIRYYKKLKIFLNISLFIILFYSSLRIGIYINEWYSNKKVNEKLSESYHKLDIRIPDNTNMLKLHEERFKGLLEINKDVVGWIKITGTKIDYPVLQSDDNEFYLKHNINKEVTSHGSIFIDYRNSHNEEANTVVYGHSMKDGSMFGELYQYKNVEFYKNHPYIEYDSLKQPMKWEIFSVYIYQPDKDYIIYSYNNDSEYVKYLEEISSKSIHGTDVVVTKDDKILTLVTCSYESSDSRLVIHAKRI